jgi:SAM-dependent methyltransferase
MVKRARAKGHEVVEADALEHLAEQHDASAGAVFAARAIEHLPPEELAELLRQARRVLRSGGILVLETANPYSIPAFRSFWTDRSHRSPIFPEVLVVACRDAAFDEAVVIFPNGSGELETDRWNEGEYAVIARVGTV